MIRIRRLTPTSKSLVKVFKSATQSFKVRIATYLRDRGFLGTHCPIFKLQDVCSSSWRRTREDQFSWNLQITESSSVIILGIIRQHRAAVFICRRVIRKCAITCFIKILWPRCPLKTKAKPLLYQKVLGEPFIFRVSTRRASKLFFSPKTRRKTKCARWS